MCIKLITAIARDGQGRNFCTASKDSLNVSYLIWVDLHISRIDRRSPTSHHVQDISRKTTDAAERSGSLWSVTESVDGCDFGGVENGGKSCWREGEKAFSIGDGTFREENDWSFGSGE